MKFYKFISLVLCCLIYTSSFAGPRISYTLTMEDPHLHYFQVEMTIQNLEQDVVEIKMPVWTPGSYLVREYAKNVEQFIVKTDQDEEIKAIKSNKNTWRIENGDAKSITVQYSIYSFEKTVRTSFLDESYGYINPASVFMYLGSEPQLASTLNINPYKEWSSITTALKTNENGHYDIPDLDTFIDSPILIGNQEVIEFEANGFTHHLAIEGFGNFDREQLLDDFKTVCETTANVFKYDHPCEEYTIILLNTENSYGGLEHKHSTTMIYQRWNYQPEERYFKILSLLCHEYFHLWNVKRIRPEALGPFNYEAENYTNGLWIMEGFTSYYDEYLVYRAGLIDEQTYLKKLGQLIAQVENTPGNFVQPVADASWDSWIKYYRKDENSNNCCISYYTKGAVLAFALDVMIRENTNGKKSLDHLMNELYAQFYLQEDKGFSDEEFQTVAESVYGGDLDWFFNDLVYDCKPVPYEEIVEPFGLSFEAISSQSTVPQLGVRTSDEEGRRIIKSVSKGTSAYEAGLNVNDELIAINGFRLTGNLSTWMERFNIDDMVQITVCRDGILKEIPVNLWQRKTVKININRSESISNKQQKLVDGWLNSRSEN